MLPDPSGFGAEDIVCPQEWRCKRFGFRIFSGDFDDRKNRLTDYSKGRRRKKKKEQINEEEEDEWWCLAGGSVNVSVNGLISVH